MSLTRLSFRLAVVAVVCASMVPVRAQMGLTDIYREAGNLYGQAAAKVGGVQGQCYLMMQRHHECLRGMLTGGSPTCPAAPTCSVSPAGMLGGVMGMAGGAGIQMPNVAAGADAARRMQQLQQAQELLNVGVGVFKGIMGWRKRRQAQREAEAANQRAALQQAMGALGAAGANQPQAMRSGAGGSGIPHVDPRTDLEARQMQEMAQMLARQRAELERADRIIAAAQSKLDAVDKRMADVDARLRAADRYLAVANGAARTNDQPQQDQPGAAAAATGGDCPRGWADKDYRVTEFGNDDLFLETGALAFLTDSAGKATSAGSFLSVQYVTGRRTHVFLGIGSSSVDFPPGHSQMIRLTQASASPASVDVRVRFCEE